MRTFVWCAFGLLLLLPICAMAQNQLGTVSNVNPIPVCPRGYFDGMQCSLATVSCPNVADIQVTFGYLDPAGTPKGTVFFHAGSGGTAPYGGGLSPSDNYLTSYLSAGYQLVQMSWTTDWEDVGTAFPASIGTAACRPATLMQYVYQNIRTAGAMCAQGSSGGSAAIAYALAWYNAASYVDKVELISGPVFGDVEKGCSVPDAATVTVCPSAQFGCVGASWQDLPQYAGGYLDAVRTYTRNKSCQGGHPTNDQSDDAWQSQSIVNGSPSTSFFYPQTAMAAWLCSNGLNNSAAQGQYYYANFTSASQTAAYSVTRVDGCEGPEVVEPGKTPSGEVAFFAIVNDMTDANEGCVLRH
jgi:hypothetical protein